VAGRSSTGIGSANATLHPLGPGERSREQPVGARERGRHQRGARLECQPTGAPPGRAEGIRVPHPGALGEQREQAVLAQDLASGLERVLVGLAAPHRERSQAHQQAAPPALEQLGLAHEAEVAGGGDGDEERVPERLVVGGDDGRAGRGDVLGTRDQQPEVHPQEGHEDRPHERVERPRDPLLAGDPVGLAVGHAAVTRAVGPGRGELDVRSGAGMAGVTTLSRSEAAVPESGQPAA
jgi:hypothetical protein